jgi:hypothetical protein
VEKKVTDRVVVVAGSRVENPGFCTLEDGPKGCPEKSVRNYRYLLCNNPVERGSLTMELIIYVQIFRCSISGLYIDDYYS